MVNNSKQSNVSKNNIKKDKESLCYQPIRNSRNINSAKNDSKSPLKKSIGTAKEPSSQLNNNINNIKVKQSKSIMPSVPKKHKATLNSVKQQSEIGIEKIVKDQRNIHISQQKLQIFKQKQLSDAERLNELNLCYQATIKSKITKNQYFNQIQSNQQEPINLLKERLNNNTSHYSSEKEQIKLIQQDTFMQDNAYQHSGFMINQFMPSLSQKDDNSNSEDQHGNNPNQIATEQNTKLTEQEQLMIGLIRKSTILQTTLSASKHEVTCDENISSQDEDISNYQDDEYEVNGLPNQRPNDQITLQFDKQPINHVVSNNEPLYTVDNEQIANNLNGMQGKVAAKFKNKKIQENKQFFKLEHQKMQQKQDYEYMNFEDVKDHVESFINERSEYVNSPKTITQKNYTDDEQLSPNRNHSDQLGYDDKKSKSMQFWNTRDRYAHITIEGKSHNDYDFGGNRPEVKAFRPDHIGHSQMSPSYQKSKEIYMLDKHNLINGLNGIDILQKRKISQTMGKMTKSSRISKMSSDQSKRQSYLLDINQGNNLHKLQSTHNRKSVGQIISQGLKEAGKLDKKNVMHNIQNQAKSSFIEDTHRNVKLLVSKTFQRKLSASRKRNEEKMHLKNDDDVQSASIKNLKKQLNRYQQIERLNTAELKNNKIHQKIKIEQVGLAKTKNKNPPLTSNFSIAKSSNIQPFGIVESQMTSMNATKRTRIKKHNNAPPLSVLKLITETEQLKPSKNAKKFQTNNMLNKKQIIKSLKVTNNTVLISKSPEKSSFIRDVPDHFKHRGSHHVGSNSKTSQSLPRKIHTNFGSNLNTKKLMNMSQNCEKTQNSNLEKIRNKTGMFLPYTGVDQAFLIVAPQFVRQCTEIKEKLNNMGSGTRFVSHYVQKNNIWDKQKQKLVYDCNHSQNQPITDNDAKLHVPQSIRKNGGAHINDKVSKYYHRLHSFYTPIGKDDSTLVFESRFESGNLGKATQVGDFIYDLELRCDYQSFNQLLTQWYFFKISNVKKNVEYQFNIVNLIKPDSSYNHGMKPLVYSEKHVQVTGNGWYRGGYDIKYFQSPNKVKKITGNEITHFILSFKITFEYDDDIVYLSHCYPYTYSDLVSYLNRVCNPVNTKGKLKRTQMCRTVAGNSVDMLIITNLESTQDQIAERTAIIISSRVHPGESNASFIMEGIIDFLLSNRAEALILRDKYVFKIIPMLNPDGVIVGNYRCSLGGHDLNRQWMNPSKHLSPEIFSIKEMIKKTLECRKVDLFVDIHGHSRQKNLFIFGCSKNQNGPHLQTITNPDISIIDKKQLAKANTQANGIIANGITTLSLSNITTKEKVFPWMLAQNCEDFNFHTCMFGVNKAKETTGRVVVFREFNVTNSYTLECSFCGPTQGSNSGAHFNIQTLINMGTQFAKTILDFSSHKTFKQAQSQIETFYKNGAIQLPDKKLVKEMSRQEILINISKLDKLNSNSVPNCLITTKSKNAIQLEPLVSQSPVNKKLLHKKHSIKILNQQNQNENKFIHTNGESVSDVSNQFSVRKKTVKEMPQTLSNKNIEFNKMTKIQTIQISARNKDSSDEKFKSKKKTASYVLTDFQKDQLEQYSKRTKSIDRVNMV